MSELLIPRQILDEMLAHCREGHPNEACGILAGRGNEVLKIYKIHNLESSPVSYLMDSMEQFRGMKDMRENSLDMLGIFHSHPSSAAYPSPKDVSLAFYEDAAYVIVSFAGKEPEVKAFSIRGGEIREVGVVVKEKSSDIR
jgi:proteasome lid subunit RPN8/RPN11